MNQAINVFRSSFTICLAELRTAYTWRTWVFGWLLRLVVQVVFFALVGKLIGTEDAVRFIVIGNIAALPCLEAVIVIASVAAERMSGTLPLLVLTPTSHVPIYLGRGVQWLATGFASSSVALLVAPPLLGVPLSPAEYFAVLPLLLLIGVSSYCYGCVLAGVALRWASLDLVLLNLSYIVVMAFCGVNVPASYWPEPVQWITSCMPVTHGLAAIRSVVAGDGAARVLHQALLEVLVAAAWLAVAWVFFDRLVARGREDGSLEHSA